MGADALNRFLVMAKSAPPLLLVSGAALVEGTAIAVPFLFYPGLEAWQLATRYTGRVSLLVFGIVYLCQAAHHLAPGALFRWMLTFSILHGVHFYFIVAYNSQKNGFPVTFKLAGGGLAYLLTALLPVMLYRETHHKASRRWIEGALHFLLLIFALTYVSRWLIEPIEGIPARAALAGLLITMLLALLFYRLRRRERLSATGP